MRTQPQDIIARLEADNSRLAKEQILAEAAEEGLTEFFDGVRMCLDNLYTFGVKEVPVSDKDGQGLSWDNFKQLAESLYRRELTGHAARDAIQLAMDVATKEQWNGFFSRILRKDLRCGVSEKTVNKVLKKFKDIAPVPVFECMLAQDSANHKQKMIGKKIVQPKLDGVRCLTVIDYENKTVAQYSRNGHEFLNFTHITDYLSNFIEEFGRSLVIDAEVVSTNFQALMKQARRKEDADASDAKLMVFDVIPLVEFKQGRSTLGQRRRLNFLKNFENIFGDSGFIEILPWREFDLDSLTDEIECQDYMREMVDAGYEGIMLKDPDASYVCKRDTAWMKSKPFIEVTLAVVGYEEGTGRNEGRLGALICEGEDDGKTISVNCGSGFSDSDRGELWKGRDSLVDQIVEVRADAITQNQDGTYSLRFPRFKTFRGFKKGEKL